MIIEEFYKRFELVKGFSDIELPKEELDKVKEFLFYGDTEKLKGTSFYSEIKG